LHNGIVDALVGAYAEEESGGEMHERPLLAEALLRDAVREGATDIHLDTQLNGILVRLRIDGRVLDAVFLDKHRGQRLVNQFKAMARLSPVVRYIPEEGRITHEVDGMMLDLRLSHAPCLRGDKISIRLFVPQIVPTELSQLGLREQALEDIQEWLDDVSGMLLVAGPTGSGKTTTLYTLLHKLKRHERNVVTIEDPVEYEIAGINHIQVDAQHGLGFVEGIKAMLRLDPDYLMMGEIRDAASAHAAITAAASGHALMSTLHSRDAVGVLDTLRNYGLGGQDVSSTLMLVVAQRLVRTLCPACRVAEAPTEEDRRWLQRLGREVPQSVWHARGCAQCRDTGYKGRTGVFEVWRINAEEYQLILKQADRRTLYRSLAQRGHRFLLDDGLDKVSEGVTTLSELHSMGGFGALPTVDTVE
jgi:type II secretory ATPase GspE/PulE/Tfp pilus assembly ATPase PilB-like protein